MHLIRLTITLLLIAVIAITTQAQAPDRTCYDRLRTLGIEDYNAKKYEEAIKKWEAAKTCSFVPADNDLDSWIAKAKAPVPKPRQSYEPEMVLAEGSTFQMGSNDGYDAEKPIHAVALSDFYISKYEVTQAQWQAVMISNPSYFKNCNQCPVEQVSWDDTQEFIRKLNENTGRHYRLPTEAEWEYAARGGKKTNDYKYVGSNNLDAAGWYNKNADNKSNPVGQKKANELGMYDMNGNVWEWVQDCWHGNYAGAPTDGSAWTSSGKCNIHVIRGGAWSAPDYTFLVAHRGYANEQNGSVGFRLVMDK